MWCEPKRQRIRREGGEQDYLGPGLGPDAGHHLLQILLKLGHRNAAPVVVIHSESDQHEIRMRIEHLGLQALQSLDRAVAAGRAIDRRDPGLRMPRLKRRGPPLPENEPRRVASPPAVMLSPNATRRRAPPDFSVAVDLGRSSACGSWMGQGGSAGRV